MNVQKGYDNLVNQTQINKNTLIPISVALGICVFLLGFTVTGVSRFVVLEEKLRNTEKINETQTQRLIQVSSQLENVNSTLIRQNEILKNLEQRLKRR